MSGNFKLSYKVDLTLCIDCTESMDNILNIVKQRALSFYDDIYATMSAKGKQIDQLRVRVVAFRDYLAFDDEVQRKVMPNVPMQVTDFFTLPQEAHKLEVSVKSLIPMGGGDVPEDGLEALAYAIQSYWNADATKNRHVIVLWTDAAPHALGTCAGASRYPRGMARNMEELTRWWGDNYCPGFMPLQAAKRLILFAPDEGDWSYISRNWDNVIHYPSRAGDGLREIDYETILGSIAQTLA